MAQGNSLPVPESSQYPPTTPDTHRGLKLSTYLRHNALEAYKKKTKRELISHPLFPDLVLTVLREQIPAFGQSLMDISTYHGLPLNTLAHPLVWFPSSTLGFFPLAFLHSHRPRRSFIFIVTRHGPNVHAWKKEGHRPAIIASAAWRVPTVKGWWRWRPTITSFVAGGMMPVLTGVGSTSVDTSGGRKSQTNRIGMSEDEHR